jgi:Tfp pilus assembly protein PilF
MGQHDRALADYNEAIRLDPKSQLALVNRALLYMMMSDHKHARADFDSVLALPLTDKWAVDTAREGLGFLK